MKSSSLDGLNKEDNVAPDEPRFNSDSPVPRHCYRKVIVTGIDVWAKRRNSKWEEEITKAETEVEAKQRP